MNRIVSLIGIGALVLTSCNTPQKKTEDKASAEKNVKIEFTGTDSFDIKKAALKVSLYGIDSRIADAPATLITQKDYEEKAVPFTIELPIPENPESLIKPAVAKGDPVKYYVTLSWDSNGDGKEDKGDIVIDYDKKFPNVSLDENTQQIYLKVSK